MFKIKKDIFSEPSGNIAGIIIALCGERQERRIAHAYVFTDGAPSISLDRLPNKLSIDDVRDHVTALTAFCDAVDEETSK